MTLNIYKPDLYGSKTAQQECQKRSKANAQDPPPGEKRAASTNLLEYDFGTTGWIQEETGAVGDSDLRFPDSDRLRSSSNGVDELLGG